MSDSVTEGALSLRDRPSVRLVMNVLSGWILSLILTEFFKGAYRVFDVAHAHKHAWAATFVLGSCALFMSKQVADLVLYFRNAELYDPPFKRTDTLGTLWRYAAENAVEVLILFFCYGSVHQICVQNLTEGTTKTSGFLPCAAGSGLLASMAIVEFLWCVFDWLYIYKRRRNIKDFVASKVDDGWFEFRWYPDSLIVEWIQLNAFFASRLLSGVLSITIDTSLPKIFTVRQLCFGSWFPLYSTSLHSNT